MRILISEFMDDGAAASLGSRFEVVYDPALVERPQEMRRAIATADALIVRNRTTVDAPLLAAAPRLKVVGRLGVGLDNIDLAACAARGIDVIPATGANARSVAEYVIAAALILRRDVYRSSAAVASGEWPRAALSRGRELAGSAIGVVGFGSIGRLVGALARAIELRVLVFDAAIAPQSPLWAGHGVVFRPLDELLREADVVSLHVPLAPDTRRLIDARRLALMKPDAILINTSRGGIVDESALAAALHAGALGAAALDVFEYEPLPSTSVLAACPRVLLTPHIAGVTRESNARVSALVAGEVARALAAREPAG